MLELRANTAVDVLIGPFVDSTDGDTEETGLTLSQGDIKLSKNGQALAQKNDDTAASHDANGYYNCELDATDTNTEGNLVLIVHESGALSVRHEYNVLSEAAWDSKYSPKDDGFMDVNIKTVGRSDTQETEANNLEAACAAYSATRGLAGTALPAAAADAAGGLPISDAGGLDMDAILADTNEVQGLAAGATGFAAIDTVVDAIKAKTDSLTFTVAGDVDVNVQTWKGSAAPDMTGDAYARLGAPAGASVSADIAAAKSDTAAILVDTGTDGVVVAAASKTGYSLTATTGLGNQTANITGNLSGSVGSVTGNVGGSVASVTAGVSLADDAITSAKFDESTAFPLKSADTGATAVARTGADSDTLETISDQLDATATASALSTVAGYLDTEIAAILADTNELQTDWTNGGRLDLIVDAILADTSTDGVAVAAASVRGAIGMDAANLDTQLSAIADDASAILEDTGTTLPATLAAILEDTGTTIPGTITTIDTLIDRCCTVIIGTVSGAGTGTEVFVYGGVTATVTVDDDGNRSAVTFS
jgi:hypothetical protein